MSHTTGKKPKLPAPPAKRTGDTTVSLQPPSTSKERSHDSEQIERAVYDGMQDLRVTKPRRK